MEKIRMNQLAMLASNYQNQINQVGESLKKARKIGNESKLKKAGKRKKSLITRSKSPTPQVVSKKGSMVHKAKEKGLTAKKNQDKPFEARKSEIHITKNSEKEWKANYIEGLAKKLSQLYSPYEFKLIELNSELALLQKEYDCLKLCDQKNELDGQVFEYLKQEYQISNNNLKKEIGFSSLNEVSGTTEQEIEMLRIELTEKEELLKRGGEEKQLREEMYLEQQIIKGLSLKLQDAEAERLKLYSEVEKLTHSLEEGSHLKLAESKNSLDQRAVINFKKENFMKKNKELALEGRYLESRLGVLSALEQNLQTYHDNFQNCVNNPDYSISGLYSEYLSFLAESYEDYLNQLIQEEEAYLRVERPFEDPEESLTDYSMPQPDPVTKLSGKKNIKTSPTR